MRNLWAFLILAAAVALFAAALVFVPRSSSRATLRIFIWEEYIDPEVLALFEKEFAVAVTEDNYGSNEDLRAKLQAGASGYDLVVPSEYMVTLLARDGLLVELDLSRIPNLRNISARFRDPSYDPGHRHSVPYLWGVSGIGYNRQRVQPPPSSWGDLFEPERLTPYAGRVSLLNDMREVIGAALIHLGHSPNTVDPLELEEAKNLLLKQKAFVAKYDSEGFEDSLVSGETVMAHGWSGEVATARTQNSELEFAIPKEGTLMFVDSWAIPRGGPNRDLALEFINFTLRPEVSARIVNFVNYASANEEARTLVDPAVLTGPAYFLPEGVKFWWVEDLGDANKLYEQVWTELKGR
ncbi:MAG: spermidine/putrescine ABC transporter substrate-binding protein [Planctomycetes bacterium]|nr:spermidine/putrescine ABC transporter substrate-binding protein [Planctomycetota bacterium]